MFSCEICKISKNTYFPEHLRWLLLTSMKNAKCLFCGKLVFWEAKRVTWKYWRKQSFGRSGIFWIYLNLRFSIWPTTAVIFLFIDFWQIPFERIKSRKFHKGISKVYRRIEKSVFTGISQWRVPSILCFICHDSLSSGLGNYHTKVWRTNRDKK